MVLRRERRLDVQCSIVPGQEMPGRGQKMKIGSDDPSRRRP